MQKYDVSKFIISNLMNDLAVTEKPVISRVLISGIVDGWNNNVYFQPKEAIKFEHFISKNNNLM